MTEPSNLASYRAEREKLQKAGGGGPIVPPPGGPHDPTMDALIKRVDGVEESLKEMKAMLARFEPMIARIDASVPHLATKASVDVLSEKAGGLDKRADDFGRRIDDVGRRLDTAVTTALSRVPSWWQVPAMLGSIAAIITALYGAAKYFQLIA